MRNTITLNGINSSTIPGLLIQSLPPITKPLMRTEIEEIDGRDGDIVTDLGFSSYTKQFSIGLYGEYDINQVIAYFNSAGVVTFSNEPDKYYNYQITAQIDFERLVRYRTANVEMHCQPFKYSTTETEVTLGSDPATIISGEGNNIVLEGTSEAPFTTLTAKGDTDQTTYSGKNLFNIHSSNKGLYESTVVVDGESITITQVRSDFSNSLGWVTIPKSDSLLGKTATISLQSFTSGGGATGPRIMVAHSTGSEIVTLRPTQSEKKATFTFPNSYGSGANSFRIYFYVNTSNSGGAAGAYTTYNQVQLELGPTATDYEPYVGGTASPNPDYPQDVQVVTGEQTVNICGKNLINTEAATVGYIVRATNGELTTNANYSASDWIPVKAGTTYYQSNTDIWYSCYYDKSKNFLSQINNRVISPAQDGFIRVSYNIANTGTVMVEKGNSSTDYEPYQGQNYTISLGSTELCKIGDYQDYFYKDGDDWYIHKEIGKVDLSTLTYTTGGGNKLKFNNTISNIKYTSTNQQVGFGKCEKFTIRKGSGMSADEMYGYFAIDVNQISFNVGLNGPNPTGLFYYALATPTNTKITDSSLIEQLDALSNAHSYKGRTHITATATGTNLPYIIEAATTGNMDGTVTNSGNTTARPKLTLYGTGNIGIYLNGVQLFQIALGTEGYITIDTNAMEAYKDTTNNLKNRLVTGDYNNFMLNPGANQISFTGNSTKCVVENYSRWL